MIQNTCNIIGGWLGYSKAFSKSRCKMWTLLPMIYLSLPKELTTPDFLVLYIHEFCIID